jgi:hypothetical protein
VLLLKHLPDRSACLRAEVVRLADAAAGAVGECSYGRSKSAGEDACIEGASARLFVGWTGGGLSRKDFPLSVVDQGLEVALVPQVHSLREAQTNVLGSTKHCCDEHQGSFRIPSAFADASEFGGEDGKEAPPHSTSRGLVACGGDLCHPPPSALPERVIGEVAMEMRPVVVVDVISIRVIQKAVCRGYEVAGQIGPRVRRYCRSGGRL